MEIRLGAELDPADFPGTLATSVTNRNMFLRKFKCFANFTCQVDELTVDLGNFERAGRLVLPSGEVLSKYLTQIRTNYFKSPKFFRVGEPTVDFPYVSVVFEGDSDSEAEITLNLDTLSLTGELQDGEGGIFGIETWTDQDGERRLAWIGVDEKELEKLDYRENENGAMDRAEVYTYHLKFGKHIVEHILNRIYWMKALTEQSLKLCPGELPTTAPL